jgi:hypothetical protein
MQEYPGMNFIHLHFMDHGLDRMTVQFIYENGIIMMNIGSDSFIDGITEKKRFVIEIYFDVHE